MMNLFVRPAALRYPLLLALLVFAPVAARAQAYGVISTYAYSGASQTYTVPAGITRLRVRAQGAQGWIENSVDRGSIAGVVTATVVVVPGEVLTVEVGGAGVPWYGGYNGGGIGPDLTHFTAGGGGATDLRRAPAVGRTDDYLASRNALLVAGGGGSGSATSIGGAGSYPRGGSPKSLAELNFPEDYYPLPRIYGGSQTGPGGGFPGGINNVGGSGIFGGGGGYYGGGGGDEDPEDEFMILAIGGAGGSSWASPTASSNVVYETYGYHPALNGILSITTVAAPAPLPVELTAFTATPAGPSAVRLTWATASEKNSARFEVERSRNAETFAPIGTVAAAGSSNGPRSYGFNDTHVPKPQSPQAPVYYRLRQIDQDGSFHYSPVRVVAVNGPAELALFPNPTTSRAATLTGVPPAMPVTVFDAIGRPVMATTADATGTAALVLPTGQAVGLYLVRAGRNTLRLLVK